jgi:uncharacterized membrane protein YczE
MLSVLAVPSSRRTRRLVQLYAGLLLYGISDGMMLLAGLGVDPWDVLHQGLSRRLGLGVGTWALIVGGLVLLLWLPLRQRPGFGTVSNALVVGPVIDLVLVIVPAPSGAVARIAMLLGGVILNGVATGAYIGAGLGPGPRDGLMTGLAARGHSVRVARTGIELTVLAAGWLLGGTVGLGTVIYALGIGPLVHLLLPIFRIGGAEPPGPAPGRGAPDTAPASASAEVEVTLRLAAGDDHEDLVRLAQLDSAAPLTGRILIAELSGRPVAALSLSGERVIADPFTSTTAVVALLRARARQLAAPGARRARRLRVRRWARAADRAAS